MLLRTPGPWSSLARRRRGDGRVRASRRCSGFGVILLEEEGLVSWGAPTRHTTAAGSEKKPPERVAARGGGGALVVTCERPAGDVRVCWSGRTGLIVR
jgi:hypothetical protein